MNFRILLLPLAALCLAGPALAAKPPIPPATRACKMEVSVPEPGVASIEMLPGGKWRVKVDASRIDRGNAAAWDRWRAAARGQQQCLEEWVAQANARDEENKEFFETARGIRDIDQLRAYSEAENPIDHPAYILGCKRQSGRDLEDCVNDWGRNLGKALREDSRRLTESFEQARQRIVE